MATQRLENAIIRLREMVAKDNALEAWFCLVLANKQSRIKKGSSPYSVRRKATISAAEALRVLGRAQSLKEPS